MWKARMGGALAAAMLVVGGAAQANEPAAKEIGTGTEVEKQSGQEAHPLSHIRGENARKLQEKLQAEGFYTGQIDGILGPMTQEALVKFQESKGFAATGTVDMQTASVLGIELSDVQPVRGEEPAPKPEGETSVDPAASPTPMTNSGSTTTPDTGVDKAGAGDAAIETEDVAGKDETEIETQAGTTLDKETIRQVEEALKTKNVFTGKVDGVIEADTTNAIRRFQSENGIAVTGRLDVQTLNALGVKVPDTMPGGKATPTPADLTPENGATPLGTPSDPIDRIPE